MERQKKEMLGLRKFGGDPLGKTGWKAAV